MAKVTLNPMIKGISGKFGGFVFRSTIDGVVMSRLPTTSRVKPSEAQNAQRQRFREAIAYAKTALADPQVSSIYKKAAAEQNKRPFDLAVSDFLKGRNLLTKPGG
jgi:hypothetical protein